MIRTLVALPVILLHRATGEALNWLARPEDPYDYASRTNAEIDDQIERIAR